jgi:hypothetical protein
MAQSDPDPAVSNVRLQVSADEREVLLLEFDGFLQLTAALYRQIGHSWDPENTNALTPDVARVVHARAQLMGPDPWQLQGTAADLELLLTRLRAAAELALQRGAGPSPDGRADAMNRSDTGGTDTQLDILSVSDALLAQIPPRAAG